MNSSRALPLEATEGFRDAGAYDTHRPSYPPEAVTAFLSRLKLADRGPANVVEIASGTGKFTELLAAAGGEGDGLDVRAVEPHAGMRTKLVEKDLRGVQVLEGSADAMPVDDEWGDACVAAQSFHWFATPEALHEIHRVLRPGAVFGMIWNIEDYNKTHHQSASTQWEQKLNDFIWTLDDGLPRFRNEKWKEVFETQPPSTPFQVIKDTFTDHLPRFSLPIGEQSVKWTIWLSEDALWARINTLSQVVVLAGEERKRAVEVFKEALAGGDVERNEKGDIAMHGMTYFAWTDRL